MRVSADAVATLITIFMIARRRGHVDPQTLEPVLRSLVERGYAADLRRLFTEIVGLVDRYEQERQTASVRSVHD